VLGYCRCVASLSEVVEAAVLDRGGEVFRQDLRVQRRSRRAAPAACWAVLCRAGHGSVGSLAWAA